jgi:rfaE bifunctional protein nucleotidyltransferase chain/domain
MGIVLRKEEFVPKVAARANAGERVVLAHAVFDLLHPGHIRFLESARSAGDVLAVIVESDDSVRRRLGSARPVIPEAERAELLAALACVDYVVVGDDATREAIVEQLGPGVVVKSAVSELEDGANDVGYSTSALIEKIKRTKTPGGNPAGESSQQNRKE